MQVKTVRMPPTYHDLIPDKVLHRITDIFLDSGLFQKFFDYIVELHKLDCLELLHYKSELVRNSGARLFTENFFIKIKDKKLPNNYFETLAKSIHIRELTDTASHFEACEQAWAFITGYDADKVQCFRQIIYDILSFNEHSANDKLNTLAWKKAWSEFENSLIIDPALDDFEKVKAKREAITMRTHFIFDQAAFHIASAVCNAISTKDQGFSIECLSVFSDSLEDIEKKIYLEAIKHEQSKGIVKFWYGTIGWKLYYYSIRPMGLIPNTHKLQDSLNVCNYYVRTEKAIINQGEIYPLPTRWQDKNRFNNQFPADKIIPKLSNKELDYLYNTLTIFQDCIVEAIPIALCDALADKFKHNNHIFTSPNIHQYIYEKFTESQFHRLKEDLLPAKLTLSGFILTNKALFYYYPWENKLQLITEDAEKLIKIEEFLFPSIKSKPKQSKTKQLELTHKQKIAKIHTVTGFIPEPFAVIVEEKPKHKKLPQVFLGKMTSSSSPRSPTSQQSSTSPRSSSSPSLSPSTSPNRKLLPEMESDRLKKASSFEKPKKIVDHQPPRKKSLENRYGFHKSDPELKSKRSRTSLNKSDPECTSEIRNRLSFHKPDDKEVKKEGIPEIFIETKNLDKPSGT